MAAPMTPRLSQSPTRQSVPSLDSSHAARPSRLSCDQCGETFQRREHRDRHMLRHSGSKPFVCRICAKGFARNDSLLRHRALHTQSRAPSVRRRRRQACLLCARLKQRCDGGLPCTRCSQRESFCSYDSSPTCAESTLDHPAPAIPADIALNYPEQVSDQDTLPITVSDHTSISSLESLTFAAEVLYANPALADASNSQYIDNHGMFIDASFPSALPCTGGGFDTFAFGMSDLLGPWTSPMQFASTPGDYLAAQNTSASSARSCQPFPEIQAASLLMAGADVFGHVNDISQQSCEGLHHFYRSQQRDPGLSPDIPSRILHSFIELYFEHFDPYFPFLHPSRLEAPDLPWLLLLATAAVGSHYSEIQEAPRYNSALRDLLERAVDLIVSVQLVKTDVVIVQVAFLLHILWTSSGSHRDKVVLHRKRSLLISLCRELIGKTDKPRSVDSLPTHPEQQASKTWQTWLDNEERVRLFCCVRVRECLESLFLDPVPVIGLCDLPLQLPAGTPIWRCRNEIAWRSQLDQADQPCPISEQPMDRTILMSEPFISKLMLLELHLDQRTACRQLHASRVLRSSLASFLSLQLSEGVAHESGPSTGPTGTSCPFDSTNDLLDTSITYLTLGSQGDSTCVLKVQIETLFHVLGIVRYVPIETLYAATGWKVGAEAILKSQTQLRNFFRHSRTKARKCLWHATCIFKKTRNTQRFACYDTFSLIVATCYIYCYGIMFAAFSTIDSSNDRAQTQRPIVRLDQLTEQSAIKQWIDSGPDDSSVHLTGVGLLESPEFSACFLSDIERTLSKQTAWRGLCHVLAHNFSQLRRGEALGIAEPDELQEPAENSTGGSG